MQAECSSSCSLTVRATSSRALDVARKYRQGNQVLLINICARSLATACWGYRFPLGRLTFIQTGSVRDFLSVAPPLLGPGARRRLSTPPCGTILVRTLVGTIRCLRIAASAPIQFYVLLVQENPQLGCSLPVAEVTAVISSP